MGYRAPPAPLLLVLLLAPVGTAASGVLNGSFLTDVVRMRPGEVFRRDIGVYLPGETIGIRSFAADLVFEGGVEPVPLSHTYMHHWFVVQKHAHNAGFCELKQPAAMTLDYFFGVGSESRRTPVSLPEPYVIVVDNRDDWILDLHTIDLRNTTDPLACRECLCKETNVDPQIPDYIGGLACCHDGVKCRTQGPDDRPMHYQLRYNLTWVEDEELKMRTPVDIFVMDVTGKFDPNEEVQCAIEYDVPRVEGDIYWRNSSFSFDRSGTVVLTVPHLHSGGVFAQISRNSTGELLCRGDALYGNGTEAGNEKGYVVGISPCSNTWKFMKDEVVDISVKYFSNGGLYLEETSHVGVMGYMWMAVAWDE